MKAALVFTGSGPILVITTFESFQSPEFSQRLGARGISRFILHEVPPELVRKRYGTRLSVVLGDLSQKDDLRVMDIDGHHVFNSFSFEELGPAIYSEPSQKPLREVIEQETITSEWLWAKLDDFGNMIESSYLPMVGSRVVPSLPAQAGVLSKEVRFKIDRQGIICEGSPANLNGRKLVLPGRWSSALGRVETVAPACTWGLQEKGGWT